MFIPVTNGQALNNPDISSTGSISNPRQIIPFDNDWRFWLGDNQEAKKPGFDDKSWRTLDIPHDWEVESKSGELKADGYLKGRQVFTSILRTTGKATKLQLLPLPLPVNSDIFLYELTVCDDAGLKVIDSPATVKVLVEGTGRLIGVDSGDLVYDGLFKTDTRLAWQGRLLVAVKRTAAEGEIRVTASSTGLSTAISLTK